MKPALVNLFTSAEDNIWVRTPSTSGEALWDVFSADGAYISTAIAPGLNPLPFLPPVVRGDEFWAIATDDFDVQHVVRARTTPTG